jgi:calcineurin-like phosphoesterase
VTRLLFVGDVVGRPGRDLVTRGLKAIVSAHKIDCVIVNVENSAAGFGVTPEIAARKRGAGYISIQFIQELPGIVGEEVSVSHGYLR